MVEIRSGSRGMVGKSEYDLDEIGKKWRWGGIQGWLATGSLGFYLSIPISKS